MSWKIRTIRTAETIACINFDGGSLLIPAGLKSKEPAGRPSQLRASRRYGMAVLR